MHNMNKHSLLEKLLKSGDFDSQEALQKALAGKGIEVTQATLSRDLRKIGAIKREGRYTLEPSGYAIDGLSKVISMKYVQPNLVVMKTTPGMGHPAALLIDESAVSGVAGTIAGDDTVFIAIENVKKYSVILEKLSELFERARSRS